jgi:predicted TIM-barrel fold metal-dependent hydrolase
MKEGLLFIDSHHHLSDTKNNSFQTFLRSLLPSDDIYLPEHYERDVVIPLLNEGVKFVGSIHVECLPDNGFEEAQWIEKMTSTTILAIVASCNLAHPKLEEKLEKLKHTCPKVRGIRWILDCVGKFDGESATHPSTLRHDGIDYLRGSEGGYNGEVVAEFERGFCLLEKYELSFDLQCAPVQLEQAASLVARYPRIRVCINHLGKPRSLCAQNHPGKPELNVNELLVWREGMKRMATFPNCYVKISMLGYAIPGWIKDEKKVSLMRGLVLETVALFTPKRCMVATNWWRNAESSDADGHSDTGPSPYQLLSILYDFFENYSEEDKYNLFCGTAKEFYGV